MADVTPVRIADRRTRCAPGARRAKLRAVIAAQYQDPENARIIFFAAGGLLVLAIVLVVATILWWRSSGVEPTCARAVGGDVDPHLVEQRRRNPQRAG